jgi:uncharacterized LabA/DUF88 family protein
MKVAIFIDGGYIEKIVKIEFSPLRIDYAKLPVVFSRGKEILRSYYYDCLPYQSSPSTPEERERFSKKQRFHTMLNRLSKYEVREGRLVKRGLEFEQKGIDTLLSIDIVNLAASKMISEAILIAGDYDFVPAVKVAKEHGVNVTLYHSQRRNAYHNELWNVCDDRYALTPALIDQIKR